MSEEILIVGGGIGGFTAALALAQKGKKVRLLEKAPEFGEIGYGIQLGPNVYKMFERLGVAKAIEVNAFFPKNLVFLDALSGKETSRLNLGRAFLDRFKYPYMVIHRRDLHSALIDACKALPEVTMQTSSGVVSYTQDRDRVMVQCENGAQYEGSALIGCDGLRSAVRAVIANDGAPRASGHIAYRGVVPIDEIDDREHIDNVILWTGPHLHLVQYRLQGGTVMNNVAVIESSRFGRGERQNYGGPEELDECFARVVPRVQAQLKYVGRDRNWLLHDRDPIQNWSQGRATLLGDAAHPTLQYLAQGACMAVEDAVVLAEKVASCAGNFERAFQSYQADRVLRTTRVVMTSRWFGHFMHTPIGAARDLGNSFLLSRSAESFEHVEWLYGGVEPRGV